MFTLLAITFKRGSHCVQDILLAKRLCQKLNRAGLHGFDRHRYIAMRGDENDRYIDRRVGQFLLEIKPIYSGHTNVQDETICLVVLRASKKLGRRLKSHAPYTDRFQ
jgi:transcriptional regulator of aromatic amino acid metabolism